MSREITVLVQFVTKPSVADEFAGYLADNALERSRTRGVLRVSAQRDRNAPWRFSLLQVFESEAALERYRKSPAYVAWNERVRPWVIEKISERQDVLVDWCRVEGLRAYRGTSRESQSSP